MFAVTRLPHTVQLKCAKFTPLNVPSATPCEPSRLALAGPGSRNDVDCRVRNRKCKSSGTRLVQRSNV